MLITHLFVAVVCAGALGGGDVRAGQGAEESRETRENKMTVAVYYVDALLKLMEAAAPKHDPGKQTPPRPCQADPIESLIRHITLTIDPSSWAEVGGKATIQYFPLGGALVVNQSEAHQKEIKDLLASLRYNLFLLVTVRFYGGEEN